MASVIPFEERAVASLRARLGAVETANQDLIAFARGHSGAVASIHAAVLDAVRAEDIESLFGIITRRWPALLRIDHVALALVVGEQGFRIDSVGVHQVEPRLVARAAQEAGDVTIRSVERGHALFGAAAGEVLSEALVGVGGEPGLPHGLLLLGQSRAQALDHRAGASLLMFLGQSVHAIVTRWLTTTQD